MSREVSIILEPSGFFWLPPDKESPNDLCLHGFVEFRINESIFVSSNDGDVTLSASGLFLLRTLMDNHDHSNSVTDSIAQIFPCCGHFLFPGKDKYDVCIMGCNQGVDLEIIHQEENVVISDKTNRETISLKEWQNTVSRFVAPIQRFYAISLPKAEPKEEFSRRAWDLFWNEWKRRFIEI